MQAISEKDRTLLWEHAIDSAIGEIARVNDLPTHSQILKNLALLKQRGPDFTAYGAENVKLDEDGERLDGSSQNGALRREDVIVAIRLMLNREPKGEAELAQFSRLGSMIALRRALIKKLHDGSPVFGEDSLYKEFRAPLFLLSPPEKDVEWRLAPPDLRDPVSQLCTHGQVVSDEYAAICKELKVTPRPHRKQWEFVWITAALKKAGVLKPEGRLVGFGCGREKLPSYFASCGVEVLATDAPPEIVGASWGRGQQYSQNVDALYKPMLVEREKFDKLVSFRHADMNHIPIDIRGFDGCWSACALEHLGSLRHGLDFIRNSLDCLKPGGFAIHTTEFNLSSNDETFEHPRSSIFRKRDIVDLLSSLNEEGHHAWPLNLHPGEKMLDEVIDLPPHSPVHLKVALRKLFVGTSIGIAVRKKL
jgi:hypothetical protein